MSKTIYFYVTSVGFQYIVDLVSMHCVLNKYPMLESMLWVWAALVVVTIGPSTSREGFVCFYILFPILFMHPLWKARYGWVQSWFFESIICRRDGFYAAMKLSLFIKPLNFMQRRHQKLFYACWLFDSMHLIINHVPRFKFWIYEFYLFQKKIFKVDLESCTKISEVQWWKPF